jgi:hypothetical protein
MRLDHVSALYRTDAPIASVYLDVTGDSEDARRLVALRWAALREELEKSGADSKTIDALDRHIGMPSPWPELLGAGQGGLALFASKGEVILERRLPRLPLTDAAWWGPLPHVLPLLQLSSLGVPRVAVLADRVGADISVWGPGVETPEHMTVEGERAPLTKVQAGGWSHRRFQQRAENMWQRNAGEVAAEVDRLVVESRAKLLVLTGDERACQELRDQLAPRSREVLVQVAEGNRAAGSDSERFAEAVERLAAECSARAEQKRIDTFVQEAGRDGLAAQGLKATIAALRQAAVDTLLLAAEDAPNGELWFGPEPTDLGLARDDLLPAESSAQRDRTTSVLLRAAVGTDASVVVAEPGRVTLPDGVGALLRFRDEAMR